MVEKIKAFWKTKFDKERSIILGIIIVGVIISLWLASNSQSNPDQPMDFGLVIPKGFLIIPLELANAKALSSLVNQNAIVDVFMQGQNQALVENLRIIKLNAGEGPLFGGLVPENMAGQIQDLFSRPRLTAALRTATAGPTRFHLYQKSKTLLVEVPTGDEL
jgi:hypothetical protein